MGDKTHLCKYYCIPTKKLWAFPNNRIPFLMITFKEKKTDLQIMDSFILISNQSLQRENERLPEEYTYRGEYLKELISCCLSILLFISSDAALKSVYRILLKTHRIA